MKTTVKGHYCRNKEARTRESMCAHEWDTAMLGDLQKQLDAYSKVP